MNRHRKGGQSAIRFDRIIEESRARFITKIVDDINCLETKNNHVFGSDEIVRGIQTHHSKIVPIINGGFLKFNRDTIRNEHWINVLEQKDDNDKIYEQILTYLEIDVDMLSFDCSEREDMKFFITHELSESEKFIPMPDKGSKFYERLYMFEYIGIKYYSQKLNNTDIEI